MLRKLWLRQKKGGVIKFSATRYSMGNESKFDINLFLFDVVTLLFSISESRLYPISGEEKFYQTRDDCVRNFDSIFKTHLMLFLIIKFSRL